MTMASAVVVGFGLILGTGAAFQDRSASVEITKPSEIVSEVDLTTPPRGQAALDLALEETDPRADELAEPDPALERYQEEVSKYFISRPLMDLAFSDPKYPTDAGRAIDWSGVEREIRSYLRSLNGVRVGLVIKDLNTGYTIQHNENRLFASASLVKLPIAAALYEDFQSGRINPQRGVIFRERHRIGGSGALKSEEADRRVNFRDLIYLMLAKSDNTATNILGEVVGMDRVTQSSFANGWTSTDMVREVMALDLRDQGIQNWTSPRDMADFMEKLYNQELVSSTASRDLLRFMNNPTIGDRLPKKIPAHIDIVHKTGLIRNNAHDVGILYLPGRQPVLVAALTDGFGTQYGKGKTAIADIARIIYDASSNEASLTK